MRKPTQMEASDALYQMAAAGGRGEALFGESIELARSAYERPLFGGGYPSAYLELPLLGQPCFDMLSVHGEVEPGAEFAPGAGFGRQAMLDWFSDVGEDDAVSCGLELDASAGETEAAGAYLQFRNHTELVASFLESIGKTARLTGYMATLARMPQGWLPAYIGLFPGRPGTPSRIGGNMGRARMKGGYGTRICEALQSWGLADDRWKLTADAAFARRVSFQREDGGEGRFALCVLFSYAKVKFSAREPRPAKFYLILRARGLEC